MVGAATIIMVHNTGHGTARGTITAYTRAYTWDRLFVTVPYVHVCWYRAIGLGIAANNITSSGLNTIHCHIPPLQLVISQLLPHLAMGLRPKPAQLARPSGPAYSS